MAHETDRQTEGQTVNSTSNPSAAKLGWQHSVIAVYNHFLWLIWPINQVN